MLNNNIPIIIIHNGYSKSLYYCIASCARTNPNSQIFLIGDTPNKKLEKMATFVNINDVEEEQSALFEKSYVHLGKSSYHFEMFCIKRWFLYRNIIKKYNLKHAFCIDSDVLIFSDLNEALESYSNYRISLMMGLFGLTMYVNDVSILDEFCEFILNVYTDENEISKLKDEYYGSDRRRHVGGTINDMYLSDMFFKNYKNKSDIGDIGRIVDDGVFDAQMLALRQHVDYESIIKSRYKVKKIYFNNNTPYCDYKDPDTGTIKQARFHSLHCIVWSKILMKRTFHYKDVKLNPIIINISREYKVFTSKLKKFFKHKN